MGIRDKPIARASPWQNAFAERLIGPIRRECMDCVDHIIVLGEARLRRILRCHARYYNEIRTQRLFSLLPLPLRAPRPVHPPRPSRRLRCALLGADRADANSITIRFTQTVHDLYRYLSKPLSVLTVLSPPSAVSIDYCLN
jgi:hypothetical protein